MHVPYKAIQTIKITHSLVDGTMWKIKQYIYTHIKSCDSFILMKSIRWFEYITRSVRIHTKPTVTDKRYTVMNNTCNSYTYVCMYMHLECIHDLIYNVLQHSNTYCTIITMWITGSVYTCRAAISNFLCWWVHPQLML